MAESKNNIVTAGLSGQVAKLLVFRQVNGRTIVAKYPNRKSGFTEKQKSHHDKFAKGALYAKTAMENSSLKKFYTEEAAKRSGVSARNMALADFLSAPVIDSIDTSAYKGAGSDEKIVVMVHDFMKVVSVKVKITGSNDALIEEGAATQKEGQWVYATSASNSTLSGSKITVTATDRPGNVSTKEVTL